MKRTHAFTLLELIIVIIIIGVLAGLALPQLMNMVKAAYAPEAIQGFMVIHEAVQRCLMINDVDDENFTNVGHDCFNLDVLNVVNPFNEPGSHFKPISTTLFKAISEPARRYCYVIPAEIDGGVGFRDALLFVYCNKNAFLGTVCKGPICVHHAPGKTISGAGAFKGIQIGPGVW